MMPSGSAPRITVVPDAVFTKRQTERILCNCSQSYAGYTENQSKSCPETDLPSTSSEEACARCHVYQKTNRKIIEYRGKRIRCSVSDARVACYRPENEDCYCQPNCYARIVTLHETN